MRYITVRDVPPDLAKALEEEKLRRGVSLNQTVIDLLRRGLGLSPAIRRSNGLSRLAGSWTEEEAAEFEAATAVTEEIDEELWR